MKKLFLLMIAILLAVGFSAPMASADPTLTFGADFWTDGSNPVHNYTRGDLIGTDEVITLQPCEWVFVDLYFSLTEQGVVSGGFGLPFNYLESDGNIGFISPFIEFSSVGNPNYIGGEAGAWPPGTIVPPGEDIPFATLALHCIAQGTDELWLNDYNASAQWVTESGLVLDDQMGIQIGTITNVPVPGAVWLLGSGLLGLMGLRRRMKS